MIANVVVQPPSVGETVTGSSSNAWRKSRNIFGFEEYKKNLSSTLGHATRACGCIASGTKRTIASA